MQQIKVLICDDDTEIQRAVATTLTRQGCEVVVVSDAPAAQRAIDDQEFQLLITDQRLPGMCGIELIENLRQQGKALPIIMMTAYGTVTQAVEAMQKGATDFITKPFGADELVRIIERSLSKEVQEATTPKKRQKGRPIVSRHPLMRRVLEIAEAVARSDATVLVQGESGTGKELIARLIHAASPRAEQSFVAVNCAALPDTLLESELFGHEKGAFTGAQSRKIGKFELAHGGTILLDEISEMDLQLQAKLLRVLQEREVDRVGGKEPISIDVRVVATTNRNLEEMARQGTFRADLYYRLNVIPLVVPPLRDRRGDIGVLVEHFMRQYLGEKAPTLSPSVLQALENYPWPGNVRELQNAVERAAILSRGEVPTETDFLLSPTGISAPQTMTMLDAKPERSEMPRDFSSVSATVMQASAYPTQQDDTLSIRAGMTVHDTEKRLIVETLRSTENNRTQAAKLLGISIRTLRNKLNEYKLDFGSDSDA